MRVDGQRQAPAALPPGKRPGTLCTVSWVGPRAGLAGAENLAPTGDSIPGPSQPVASLCTDYVVPQQPELSMARGSGYIFGTGITYCTPRRC